jgi:hypothetical protein
MSCGPTSIFATDTLKSQVAWVAIAFANAKGTPPPANSDLQWVARHYAGKQNP